MQHQRPSASHVALLFAALLVTGPASAAPSPEATPLGVGEIFVDAAGRATGSHLASSIDEASGRIGGFSNVALGVDVFESLHVEGFSAKAKISGAGSSTLTLRGSNAVVSLHDDVHSVLKVRATAPTLVTYRLAPGLVATQEGDRGGILRLSDPSRGPIGALVLYAAEGPAPRGEVMQVKGDEVLARVQAGSEVVFLADPDVALVRAIAEGTLVSRYVTAFEGSAVRASQLDLGERARASTTTPAAGTVTTLVTSDAAPGALLAYDLAYETLPASSPDEIAVYVDGELATRVSSATAVLAAARAGVPSYHAHVEQGRALVLAATASFSLSSGSQHRVTLSASASASTASTERQAQAESSSNDDARVYGGFEHHANGKLTGDFLTGVLPEGSAQVLRFTALASRIEVFRAIAVDGGASATLRSDGPDRMTIQAAKAELTLVDDVLATARLVARAPTDATYELAPGVRARALAGDAGGSVLLLETPEGSAGALVLSDASGGSALRADAAGRIHVQLAPGASLLYRGEPDERASEDAVLRALAEGAFAAQVLLGTQAGEAAATTFAYSEEIEASARPSAAGLVASLLAETDHAPRALLVDARGAALAAKSAADVRVLVEGLDALRVGSIEEALEVSAVPRYHVETSLDGALRVLVNTASLTGRLAQVRIESTVQENAQEHAKTDAFGVFRLYHDGTAVGDYVRLKAESRVGAVSGLTLLATRETVFTSLVAGATPYVAASGDGASVLKLENREARIEISDTTAGFARILALHETAAAFHLAGGLRTRGAGPGVVDLLRADGGHLGTLVLVGAGAIEARGEREVRATLERGSEIAFRAHTGIESELSDAQRAMVSRAIAEGRVAGTVILQTQASIAADIHQLERTAQAEARSVSVAAREAHGELTSSVTATYGDLQVVTAATRSRVDVTVASAAEVGKTLVLSLDPETIPGMARGKASIRFDGEAVAQASSYADILDPSDDGGAAEYFVLAGDAGTQVLVSIPHFSVHTVTLEETTDHPNSLYMWATIVLGTLVVVEGVLLARSHLSRKNANTIQTRRP